MRNQVSREHSCLSWGLLSQLCLSWTYPKGHLGKVTLGTLG